MALTIFDMFSTIGFVLAKKDSSRFANHFFPYEYLDVIMTSHIILPDLLSLLPEFCINIISYIRSLHYIYRNF